MQAEFKAELQAVLEDQRARFDEQIQQLQQRLAALTPTTPIKENLVDTELPVNLDSPKMATSKRFTPHPALPAFKLATIKQVDSRRLGIKATLHYQPTKLDNLLIRSVVEREAPIAFASRLQPAKAHFGSRTMSIFKARANCFSSLNHQADDSHTV